MQSQPEAQNGGNAHKDFTLERVVRMTALATGCEYASLTMAEGPHWMIAAAHGGGVASIDPEHALSQRVRQAEETVIWAPDSTSESAGPRVPLAQVCAGEPVVDATGALLGVLSVYSSRRLDLGTPVVRRALVDGARLIEDALLMRHRSVRDPATDLFTRRLFEEQFVSEWDRGLRARLPFSLLLIGVDEFDAFDQDGDVEDLLQALARVISERTRRSGDTSYHFGGGRIAVALRGMQDEKAQRHAESIRQAVAAMPCGISQRRVTVSVGLTSIEHEAQIDELSVHRLMSMAEAALEQAQRSGGNSVQVRLPPTRRLPNSMASA